MSSPYSEYRRELNATSHSSRPMSIQDLLNPEDEPPTYQPASPSSSRLSVDSPRSLPTTVIQKGAFQPKSRSPDRHPHLNQRTRSSTSPRERRRFRPTYLQEEEYFIWYHRVDLGMDWPEIKALYNAQFPHSHRRGGGDSERSLQGIQCKYYRCNDAYGVPRVRDRKRGGASGQGAAELYGVRTRCPGLWYDWMRGESPGSTGRSGSSGGL